MIVASLGDWGMFTVPIVDIFSPPVFIMCHCFRHYFLSSFIYRKISMEPSLFSPPLPSPFLTIHNVILRCNDISDFSNADGRFISLSIIHLWAPCFEKNAFFSLVIKLLFESISLCYLCACLCVCRVGIMDMFLQIMPGMLSHVSPPQWRSTFHRRTHGQMGI